jgi:hypothetical protein
MELFTATGKLNFLQLEVFDVCTWVTRHASIRYSRSWPTRVNMGASIFFSAAMIRANNTARSRGIGGKYVRPTFATRPR